MQRVKPVNRLGRSVQVGIGAETTGAAVDDTDRGGIAEIKASFTARRWRRICENPCTLTPLVP